MVASSVEHSIRGPEGHLEKKKKPGAGKQKQVRVKKGLRGQRKAPPPQIKRPDGSL